MTDRKIAGYIVNDSNDRITEDENEAVENYLDNFYDGPLCAESKTPVLAEPFPRKLSVQPYVRMDVTGTIRNGGDALLNLLEWIDEEHGDPEGDFEQPRFQEMEEAEKAFLARIAELYVSWNCEEHGEAIEVDVEEWLRDNGRWWDGVKFQDEETP